MTSTQEHWKLRAAYEGGRPVIVESTTNVTACGDSWCQGVCGFPALVLTHGGVELRAHGIMVARGATFQPWHVEWTGVKLPVTLGIFPVEEALERIWA